MPLILSGNVASALDTSYKIDNSCLFGGTDNEYMDKSLGTPSNTKKMTWSFWTKKTINGDAGHIATVYEDGENYGTFNFTEANKFQVFQYISDVIQLNLTTEQIWKDNSAWSHFVIQMDTTQSTASNRCKVWHNGKQITAWDTEVYWDQNTAIKLNNSGDTLKINAIVTGSQYNGYVAEFIMCDGQAYQASDFGEYNSDTPTIWQPKDPSGLTFGNNGFWLDFEDSGNLGNDANGGTDLSETNFAATDQCQDSPTNNFATLNPLMAGRGSTLTEGNLKVSNESDNNYDVATFGSDMKWYYEWKVDENYDGSGGGVRLGAIHIDELSTNDNFGSFATTKVKLYTNSNDGKTQEGPGNNVITSLTRATTNDIIMCACDGTNAKIWWGINGTWLDYGSGTGDPANGTNPAPWSSNAMASGIYFPVICYSGTAAAGSLNLGNPPFSISSGNADDKGYGNFEYDVPAGFYALCTKNLAVYG